MMLRMLLWFMISKLLGLVTILPFGVDADGFFCSKAFECDSQSITWNDTVNCLGHFSCVDSYINSSKSLRCKGGYACYNARKLTNIENGDNADIECQGLYSCANVNDISAIDMECSGDLSCLNSNITMTHPDRLMLCDGARSCESTTVTSMESNTFQFNGGLSGLNAVFSDNNNKNNNTNDSLTLSYYFYGGYSGYNTTIICGNNNNNNTCYIECFGNGCNGLKILGNSNSIITDCSTAELSDICPDGYQLPEYLYPIPNTINITLISLENTINTCNSSIIFCGDNNECKNTASDGLSTTNYTNGGICCSGTDSCTDLNFTLTKYGDIGCYARQACSTIQNIQTDGISVGRGDIYLSGRVTDSGSRTGVHIIDGGSSVSGSGGDIGIGMFLNATETQLNSNFVSNNLTDIVCSGKKSCRSKIVKNSNNLFCHGMQSCQSSEIFNIFDNMYVYGYRAAYDTNISNIGNLYCAAEGACKGSVIRNVFGDVYGSGTEALLDDSVSNVSGNLIAFGYKTLAQSTIVNTTNVCQKNQFFAKSLLNFFLFALFFLLLFFIFLFFYYPIFFVWTKNTKSIKKYFDSILAFCVDTVTIWIVLCCVCFLFGCIFGLCLKIIRCFVLGQRVVQTVRLILLKILHQMEQTH